VEVAHTNAEGEEGVIEISIAEYILNELLHDELSFIDPVYQMFLYEFILKMKEDVLPDASYFTNHNNPNISTTAINLIASAHQVSDNWKSRHGIYIGHETDDLKKTDDHDLFIYKEKRLQKLLKDEKEKLKHVTNDEELQKLLESIQILDAMKLRANRLLGRTII
jgi:DNA primase